MTRGGIVWLASYPKSGNTWMRVLLANLSSGAAEPLPINDLDDVYMAESKDVFNAWTLLAANLLDDDEVDRLRPAVYEALGAEVPAPHFIKVHEAYTEIAPGEPLFGRMAARGVIYIVRDPRDVAVSLSHHFDVTIDQAIAGMNTALTGSPRRARSGRFHSRLLDWSAHVASWLDQGEMPVHLVRYEDLVVAPVDTFTGVAHFLGLDFGSAAIERAVQHSDFARLQSQEREAGFTERLSRTSLFFRKGCVGDWRLALTAAQATAIVDAHGAMMHRLGYEPRPPAYPSA